MENQEPESIDMDNLPDPSGVINERELLNGEINNLTQVINDMTGELTTLIVKRERALILLKGLKQARDLWFPDPEAVPQN